VLSELVGPLRERLRQLLESGTHRADEVARRIRIVALGARAVEPAHFRTLTTALLSRRRLRIRHLRRQDGAVLEREVSPQRLVHYRDNWYLDAWCHERKALRTFARRCDRDRRGHGSGCQ
jgi:predicted DNA-binding transcriptional regulator YafY